MKTINKKVVASMLECIDHAIAVFSESKIKSEKTLGFISGLEHAKSIVQSFEPLIEDGE